MCSWCFGFALAFQTFCQNLTPPIDVQILMGGLRKNGTETMPELKDFLQHHWEQVADRCQVTFNHEMLQHPDLVYNTTPSCQALVAAKVLGHKDLYGFFSAMQKAFYLHARNITQTEVLVEIAGDNGMDHKAFREALLGAEVAKRTEEEFEQVRALGINSFPTVVVQHNGQVYQLAKGYAPAVAMQKRLEKILDLKTQQQ